MRHPEQKPQARQPGSGDETIDAALAAGGLALFALDLQDDRMVWGRNLEPVIGRDVAGSAPGIGELAAWAHPEDRPRFRAALERCATDAGDLDEIHRVLHDDGSVRWIHWQGRTQRDAAGRPALLTGTCVDASERLRTMMQLRESEARWRALVEASPLGIDVLDLDGNPIYYNPKCEELHDRSLDEARGNGWVQAVHPDDRDRIVTSWRDRAKAVAFWAETYRFVHRDGRVVWISGRTAPIYVEGRHAGFVGTLEDITSLKQAEQALRRSEAKLRRVVDSGMMGVFYWNAEQAITDANDAFLRMLGYRREDLESGKLTVHGITPWHWHRQDDLKMAEARAAGVTSPWEKELVRRDGRAVPVLVVKALWEDSDDSGIAICVDITPQKTAELERERLLGRERFAREQAEHATRSRDEMIAVVAHDLRDPLNVFSLTVARMLSQRPADDPATRRDLQMLQRTARGMDSLIADLLDVSRIESESLTIEQAVVPVPALFRELLDQYAPQARELGIELTMDVEPGIPAMAGDQRRLSQALANLLGNALKFTDRHGSVALTARRQAQSVLCSVADTGAGIEPGHLPHLFERFWQGARTSRAGVGLGLAIAKGIIDAHGGRIWVESTLGEGSVFHFTIPAAG